MDIETLASKLSTIEDVCVRYRPRGLGLISLIDGLSLEQSRHSRHSGAEPAKSSGDSQV